MSYSQVFGGQNIFPAQLTLLELALTADVTLVWPTEQALPDSNVFADIMAVTPDAAGRVITMPDATLAGNGQSTLMQNFGADTFSVEDADGNTIGTVPSGEVWQFYLRTNTTTAGVWETFQFGTGVSSATAAALAGAGLKAITTTLNLKILPQDVSVTPHTVVEADRAQALRWTSGVGTFDLPNPATVGADWFVWIKNAGSGTLTLNPTAGTISGSSTIAAGGSLVIVSDGTNWFTMADGSSDANGFDYVAIAVAGTGDYTLAGTELNRVSYKFTGILTGARNIIVPNTIQQYWVNNATTGQFALTVKTAAGTGIVVPPGTSRILYCDGVNVVQAQIGNLFCTGRNTGQNNINNTTLLFAAADLIDVGDWHDAGGAPANFVVPPGVTAVEISCQALWSDADITEAYWTVGLSLYKNAVLQPGTVSDNVATNGSALFHAQSLPTMIVSCVAGDIFTIIGDSVSSPDSVRADLSAFFTIKALR